MFQQERRLSSARQECRGKTMETGLLEFQPTSITEQINYINQARAARLWVLSLKQDLQSGWSLHSLLKYSFCPIQHFQVFWKQISPSRHLPTALSALVPHSTPPTGPAPKSCPANPLPAAWQEEVNLFLISVIHVGLSINQSVDAPQGQGSIFS